MRAVGITRSPEVRPISALSAESLVALLNPGRGNASADRIFITDLSLGGWRSHHAARELFDSAELDFPEPAPPPRNNTGFSYAGLIGQGIDTEARGSVVVLSALQLADALVERLRESPPVLVVVVAPRFGIGLGADNRWFLQFLEQGLRGGPHRIALVRDGGLPADLPATWELEEAPPIGSAAHPNVAADDAGRILTLMPGKVTPAALSELGFADAEGLLIATGAGDFLVPPETRRAPADVSPFEFDDLAARAKNLPWLRCYAQTFGNNYFVDSGLLAAQAWRFFAQGASEIAVRLLERAVACGRNPDARHALEAQLQGMRIASHRFAEAGKARSPPGGATNVKNFLIKAKGWALVMSGDAASGRDFLRQARLLSEIAAPGSVEDLYLRNILALAEARTGDLGEALRLEQEITAANGRLESFDWRLHYVNMVNTARLFRAAGRPTDARDAYVDAFATGSGNLSESDRVYDEACLARLAAETGCPARAMQHWFRASLAFAASAVPEALSARCAAMLLSRRTDPDQDVTEGVAEALYAALEGALAQLPPEHAWHGARLPDRGHSLDAPTFIYAGVAPPRSLAEAFGALGADGWSVIPVRSAMPPAFGGASHRSLRLLLARLIEREAPQHARLGFATYVVDARQGRPIASCEREQIESCVSLRLNRSIFAGRRTELSPASLGKLEQASRLRLGDLVRHVEMAGHRARVVYKRYLPERCEDDEYGLIEAAVAGDISLGTLLGAAERDISREIRARARDLEDKRVICCDLPPSWRRSIDEDES